MPQGVECDRGEALGGDRAAPGTANRMRFERLELDVTKDECRRVGLPLAELDAELELPKLVSAQYRDRLDRQFEIAPAAFRLWRFEPQAGARLLEGSLDAQGAGVEIYVAPLKAEELAAAEPG